MKVVYQPKGFFYWKDKLVKIIYINTGMKSIGFESVEEKDGVRCSHCGEFVMPERYDVIEDSPLFQENAKPVDTLTNNLAE